jgi:hypothetical protein
MITCINLSKPRKSLEDKINEVKFNYMMLPKDKQKKIDTFIEITQTALVITVSLATPVNAAASDKIISALNPLIDLVQAMGYPLAVLSMTGGAITMMFNKRLGVKIIKDTAIAFLVLQFVPGLMKILLDVGRALRQ